MRIHHVQHRRAPERVDRSLAVLLLAISFGTFAPAAFAQARAVDTVPTLTLGRVFGEARRANPRIAASLASARAVRAQVPAAGTLPDPQIQFGLMNYSLWDLRPMETLGMVQLQVMQMFPIAGQLRLSSRIAASRADAATERAADLTWDVRSQTAAVFYRVYALDARIAIATETLRILSDIASIARTMYEVGEGRQADVLRAQVEIARMNEEITTMRAMRSADAGRLNALLDRSYDSPVSALLLPRFPREVPLADSLVRHAMDARPVIRATQADLAASEQRVRLAQRDIWPDVQIGAIYGRRPGGEQMASLMIGASLPVFAGRRQYPMRDEAAAMRAMAAADVAAMRADTRGLIAAAHAELMRARTLSALYRTTIIPQADATVESALAAYRVGRVDFMTLLDNQMSVNEYRQALATLDAEEGTAWAELEMLIGQELIDTNTGEGR
jgi:outer membrane protein TolC